MPKTRKHKRINIATYAKNRSYNANISNSSSSSSVSSMKGIKNRTKRKMKNYRSDTYSKYNTNNARIIADISSRHNMYDNAKQELLNKNKKLSQIHIEVLLYKLRKIYNV